ncbi:hypothetical protein [Glutamicibacter sp. M10]|uniref:hypothetical protein n=1 Tax=Glutamicibacter sp. M10 TaxID=3023076 RepID=UPI0021C57BB7|nr:hypothetical protein [Glutamicibacter sp. M10]UXN32136.1 hypothetical protein N6V40_01105 [Glutamicibacter sp. M10]
MSVVEETTQEQSSGLDPSWFPPMANFGHTILVGNGLLNIENDQGGEFMAVNGNHSVASSVNTFRFSDEGEALPETLIYRVQFGTKIFSGEPAKAPERFNFKCGWVRK